MKGTAKPKGIARQGLAVRHGSTVAHVGSVGEAAALMQALASPSAPEFVSSELQVAASCSANAMLSSLRRCFPLVGPAARNFGTALRVTAVRQQLQHGSIRGVPLLKVLGWVAAAADALRHLTPQGIAEAAVALEAALVPFAAGCEDASPLQGVFPLPGALLHERGDSEVFEDSVAADREASSMSDEPESEVPLRKSLTEGDTAAGAAADEASMFHERLTNLEETVKFYKATIDELVR